jgi:hypothetical protein
MGGTCWHVGGVVPPGGRACSLPGTRGAFGRGRAMPVSSLRFKTFASWVLRMVFLGTGLGAFAAAALDMLGGPDRFMMFTRTDMHRFTAMAMLTGTLRLRGSVARLGLDEEFHDGAVFSHWGFGVPILQVPFHAVASKWMHTHFFPDRAIFLVYHLAVALLLWAGFSSLARSRSPGTGTYRRDIVAWGVTFLVFSLALYPLLSCRFSVYEETIGYFVLAELAALGAYLVAARSGDARATAGVAVAAGIGLLVRPTGLVYAGAWTAMVLLLDRRRKRAWVAYFAAGVPFFLLWMILNWERTGSATDLGFANSVVLDVRQAAMQRFGSTCVDTAPHLVAFAGWLFRALFVAVPAEKEGWLDRCHVMVEEHPPAAAHEPLLGPGVLAALVWILVHLVARRERRLSPYVPFVAFCAVFGCYVAAGGGLAWRYEGDFWPLVVLAAAEYVRTLPRSGLGGFRLPATGVLAMAGYAAYARTAEPWPSGGYYGDRWETVSGSGDWASFLKSRWEKDNPQPSRRTCADHVDGLPAGRVGWNDGCDVDIVTSTYLGVPAGGDGLVVRLETEGLGQPPLAVLVNGRKYRLERTASGYEAPVVIRQSRLYEPLVLVTVEWARDDSPGGKLKAIELAPRG